MDVSGQCSGDILTGLADAGAPARKCKKAARQKSAAFLNSAQRLRAVA
jgi:hypothetical protein